MNFIYGMLMMIILGFIFLITGQIFFPVPPTGHEFGVLQTIGYVAMFGGVVYGIIFGVFYNMNLFSDAKETYNSIKKKQKKVKVQKTALETYKAEFSEMLTKVYPKYEKELFEGMNKPEGLSALMVKYPELKFDEMLGSYIKGINELLNNIKRTELEIEDSYCRIDDYKTNDWVFGFNKTAINQLLAKLPE